MKKEELISICLNSKLKDRFDSIQFICEVLQLSKTHFLFKNSFSNDEVEKIKNVLNKFNSGVPIAKILNRANFYGIDFYVNCDVLTPRQDSELLVFLADKIIKNNVKINQQYKALDLCCGSGCLGITLKKLNNQIDLTLADISDKALNVARVNCDNLNIDCNIVNSNMFSNISGKYDLIICNPPYIKSSDIVGLENEVKNFDPIIALDAFEDGLYFYKIISENVFNVLTENGILICEFGFDQACEVKEIFDKIFKDVKIYKDNGGNERAVVCRDRRDI